MAAVKRKKTFASTCEEEEVSMHCAWPGKGCCIVNVEGAQRCGLGLGEAWAATAARHPMCTSVPRRPAADSAPTRCWHEAHAVGTLTLAHGALDVAHDQAVLIVEELHAHLGDLHAEQGDRRRMAGCFVKMFDSTLPFNGSAAFRLPAGSHVLPAASRPAACAHLAAGAGAAHDLHDNRQLHRGVLQAAQQNDGTPWDPCAHILSATASGRRQIKRLPATAAAVCRRRRCPPLLMAIAAQRPQRCLCHRAGCAPCCRY